MALAATLVGCGSRGAAPEKGPAAEDSKALYALGYSLGGGLKSFPLTSQDLVWVQKGLEDSALDRPPPFEVAPYNLKASELRATRAAAKLLETTRQSQALLQRAAAEPGARPLASGVIFQELQPGHGAAPRFQDSVKVHYRGLLPDGNEFDSTYRRGQPAHFQLAQVIPCWSQGLRELAPGGKAKLTCPASLAYGEQGAPPSVPGGAALSFEMELVGVEKMPSRQDPSAR